MNTNRKMILLFSAFGTAVAFAILGCYYIFSESNPNSKYMEMKISKSILTNIDLTKFFRHSMGTNIMPDLTLALIQFRLWMYNVSSNGRTFTHQLQNQRSIYFDGIWRTGWIPKHNVIFSHANLFRNWSYISNFSWLESIGLNLSPNIAT